jgi:hypothetical protein
MAMDFVLEHFDLKVTNDEADAICLALHASKLTT